MKVYCARTGSEWKWPTFSLPDWSHLRPWWSKWSSAVSPRQHLMPPSTAKLLTWAGNCTSGHLWGPMLSWTTCAWRSRLLLWVEDVSKPCVHAFYCLGSCSEGFNCMMICPLRESAEAGVPCNWNPLTRPRHHLWPPCCCHLLQTKAVGLPNGYVSTCLVMTPRVLAGHSA